MTFTVVRAVRGAEVAAGVPGDRLQRVGEATPRAPARMDLPYAEEVLHLDIVEFAATIPGALEPPWTVD